jgi:hypothetical protein
MNDGIKAIPFPVEFVGFWWINVLELFV